MDNKGEIKILLYKDFNPKNSLLTPEWSIVTNVSGSTIAFQGNPFDSVPTRNSLDPSFTIGSGVWALGNSGGFDFYYHHYFAGSQSGYVVDRYEVAIFAGTPIFRLKQPWEYGYQSHYVSSQTEAIKLNEEVEKLFKK